MAYTAAMRDTTAWMLAGAGLVALAALAMLLASLLRRARIPGAATGAALAGGIMAGVLLGPSVLGRTAPGLMLPSFVGATDEMRSLRDLVSEHRRELNALTATGVSPAAMTEMQRTHDVERASAEEAVERARQRHAQRWTLIGAGCVGCYLAAATLLATPARPARWRRLGGTLVMTNALPLLAGWVAVLAAAVPAGLVAWLVCGWSWPRCVGAGVIFAVPGLAAMLGPTAFLVASGGLFATFVATAIVGWSMGFSIAIAGVFLGLLATLGMNFAHLRLVRSLVRPVTLGLLAPVIAALAIVRLDLHHLGEPTTFWASTALGVLWSSDGRWLGARLALALSRSRASPLERPWTHAATIVDTGASVMQVCVALLLITAALIPAEMVAGAVIGAAVMEFTGDFRRHIAHRLDHHA